MESINARKNVFSMVCSKFKLRIIFYIQANINKKGENIILNRRKKCFPGK